MTPLTVWSGHRFSPADVNAFERAIAPHGVRWAAGGKASVLHGAESDAVLRADCDVAFGQPDPDDILNATRLRLVCLSSAGYTRYDRDDLREHCSSRGIAVCNASGVYNEPCAQHAFAMMMSVARELPAALDVQRTTRAWPTSDLRLGSQLIGPSTRIAIVGYGAIARRLVELLAPFGTQVHAFRRSPRGDENCPTSPIGDVDAALATADHVVNILPASAETSGFFDTTRFTRIKSGAAFYNIGRGDTVDQTALEAALRNGRLRAAYLDVTTPEPLPPDHPLWTTPNCYITPHSAGGSADEPARQIEHFAAQLHRFARGDAVVDRIM